MTFPTLVVVIVFETPVVLATGGQVVVGWHIVKTICGTPEGGVVVSATAPLALNCNVIVRLMVMVSGPEMGTTGPVYELAHKPELVTRYEYVEGVKVMKYEHPFMIAR